MYPYTSHPASKFHSTYPPPEFQSCQPVPRPHDSAYGTVMSHHFADGHATPGFIPPPPYDPGFAAHSLLFPTEFHLQSHPRVPLRSVPSPEEYYAAPSKRSTQLLPRDPEMLGLETMAPVLFAVQGDDTKGDPRFQDIYNGKTTLAEGKRQVFARYGWTSILLALHWPGYPSTFTPQEIPVVDEDGQPVSKTGLANTIGSIVGKLMQDVASGQIKDRSSGDWALGRGTISLGKVRIRSLKCYGKVWVPEMLVDF